MLPIKLKHFFTDENFSSDDNEPEAKKPKVIYKRCADCPSKKDRKAKYCSLKCKKRKIYISMEYVSPICKSCEKNMRVKHFIFI